MKIRQTKISKRSPIDFNDGAMCAIACVISSVERGPTKDVAPIYNEVQRTFNWPIRQIRI